MNLWEWFMSWWAPAPGLRQPLLDPREFITDPVPGMPPLERVEVSLSQE